MTLCRYKREWLVLGLIFLGAMALAPNYNNQDSSRLAVTYSIVLRGEVNIDPYWRQTIDRAFKGGHWYSDKAPGMALLAIPAVEAVRVVDALTGPKDHPQSIWLRKWPLWWVRMWTSGLAFMALAFLLGRTAEGLVAGTGAITAAVLGVGTMAGALGPTLFGHIPAALVLFAAFILSTRAGTARDWAAVGLLAGTGVLFDYPAALTAIVLVVYAAVRGGRAAALATVAGGVPAAVVLGSYNWLAFGAPWRLSYRYTDNYYTPQQRQGFFGVGLPTPHGVWTLLFDGHGLLLVSPVLVISVAGFVRFWRRRRLEASVAGVIALSFLLYTSGYFLPNGGWSPGPRFAAASLPFLLLGLPFAFVRWRVATWVLAAVSVGMSLFNELTWSVTNRLDFDAWPDTIWSLTGTSRRDGCIILLSSGAAAALVAAIGTIGLRFQERSRSPRTEAPRVAASRANPSG
jgi:hypothetical protein